METCLALSIFGGIVWGFYHYFAQRAKWKKEGKPLWVRRREATHDPRFEKEGDKWRVWCDCGWYSTRHYTFPTKLWAAQKWARHIHNTYIWGKGVWELDKFRPMIDRVLRESEEVDKVSPPKPRGFYDVLLDDLNDR